MTALLAPVRVNAESFEQHFSETKFVSFRFDGFTNFFDIFILLGVKPVKPHHIEVFRRNMYDKTFDKFVGGKSFRNGNFVFVAFVVKGDVFAVVAVDTGLCYDGAAEITADVIDEISDFALTFWSVNIKAVLSGFVAFADNLFERKTEFLKHKLE